MIKYIIRQTFHLLNNKKKSLMDNLIPTNLAGSLTHTSPTKRNKSELGFTIQLNFTNDSPYFNFFRIIFFKKKL